MTESLFITFKYGGNLVEVKGHNRQKYIGGKQRTVKLMRDLINLDMLKNEVEIICPWIRGHNFMLYYYDTNTSIKQYKHVENDTHIMEIVSNYNVRNEAELVVVLQGNNELMCSENAESADQNQILGLCNSNYVCNAFDDAMIDNVGETFLLCDSGEGEILKVGSKFIDSQHFKQALRTEAISQSVAIKIKASDKTRVIATCAYAGCLWRVRASLCQDGQTFEVRRIDTAHTCPGVNRAGNKQATATWVANEIQEIVKKNPDIPPKQLNNSLEGTYGLSFPYMKLWRSRELARSMTFGTVDDNYRWVPTLAAELIKRNPGSHILYTYESHDKSFKRFYCSFKVCRDGFLAGCRHLIGVDACHLKSKYLGVLLSANSLDGNNGLFTIAYAVVESESRSTWEWFLHNLFETIGNELEHMAFISDMEKGLAEAIKNVFPNSEHRVCMRHLWKNIKKYFHGNDGQKIQNLVWTAANAYTKTEFDSKMNELSRLDSRIHAYLLSLPYKWSKHNFDTHIKNFYNTNNMSESFNAWIGEARGKPVVDLIDMIRGMIMEQRAKRKMNAFDMRGELVPHVEEYLKNITTKKEQFIIRSSSSSKAEIEGKNQRFEVDLNNRECGCRFWQLTGLPCIHAVSFIGLKQHPLWHTYVDNQYYVIRYRMAYEGAISTLPSKDQWAVVNDIHIGVPKSLRPRGRPKKRRIKNFLENAPKKKKSVHKCSRCGLWGHHKSTCKNPLGQSSVGATE